MQLLKSETFNNLAKAYAGECQAHVRYKFIEYGARMQELTCLAELVDKVVYNEFNHARVFYTFIQQAQKGEISNIEICSGYPFKEKWDLTDNLRLATEDEFKEYKEIYPHFKAVALEEGFKEIAQAFDDVIQVESCHFKLFDQLYKQMQEGSMYKKNKKVKWKCSACGYEHESEEAWQTCPLCSAKQGQVMLKVASD